MEKSPTALRTIGETADFLGLETHVLRFWEKQFPQIKPQKQRGGRRYYTPEDVEKLSAIKQLLYAEGFTIEGAKRQLKLPDTPTAITAEPSANNPLQSELKALHKELLAVREMLKMCLVPSA